MLQHSCSACDAVQSAKVYSSATVHTFCSALRGLMMINCMHTRICRRPHLNQRSSLKSKLCSRRLNSSVVRASCGAGTKHWTEHLPYMKSKALAFFVRIFLLFWSRQIGVRGFCHKHWVQRFQNRDRWHTERHQVWGLDQLWRMEKSSRTLNGIVNAYIKCPSYIVCNTHTINPQHAHQVYSQNLGTTGVRRLKTYPRRIRCESACPWSAVCTMPYSRGSFGGKSETWSDVFNSGCITSAEENISEKSLTIMPYLIEAMDLQ